MLTVMVDEREHHIPTDPREVEMEVWLLVSVFSEQPY
jgi:hypothetical protein